MLESAAVRACGPNPPESSRQLKSLQLLCQIIFSKEIAAAVKDEIESVMFVLFVIFDMQTYPEHLNRADIDKKQLYCKKRSLYAERLPPAADENF